MSSYLAIAAVTSTLKQWLSENAIGVIDGAIPTIGRPKETMAKGVNIFLYQVTGSPDHRNDDIPTRRAGDRTLVQRPQAALDLYYLLTFYGDDLEPQILLGSTVSVLQSQPVITPEMVRSEITRRTDADADDSLAEFDMSGFIRNIIFTPLSLDTDELTKLWSVFFQVPYSLSVAYKASTVLIESDVTPQKALQVLRPDTYVLPFSHPEIEKIRSAKGDTKPIVYNSEVIISGQRLKGDITKVRMGEVEVTINPTDTANTVKDTEIKLSLDSPLFAGASLRAGIQRMSVLHPVMMGDPEVEHYGFESNTKPFMLSPTITDTTVDATDLTITVNPNVGKEQQVVVLLNEYGSTADIPHAYSLKAPDNNGITADGVTETDSITFSVENVEAGDYLLRIQVDGAESPLEISSDPANPVYNSPLVSIT